MMTFHPIDWATLGLLTGTWDNPRWGGLPPAKANDANFAKRVRKNRRRRKLAKAQKRKAG